MLEHINWTVCDVLTPLSCPLMQCEEETGVRVGDLVRSHLHAAGDTSGHCTGKDTPRHVRLPRQHGCLYQAGKGGRITSNTSSCH